MWFLSFKTNHVMYEVSLVKIDPKIDEPEVYVLEPSIK